MTTLADAGERERPGIPQWAAIPNRPVATATWGRDGPMGDWTDVAGRPYERSTTRFRCFPLLDGPSEIWEALVLCDFDAPIPIEHRPVT
jgi:hypothetical protein